MLSEGIIPGSEMLSFSEFLAQLDSHEQALRLGYAQSHINLIENRRQLVDVMYALSQADCIQFAVTHVELIRDVDGFLVVMEQLPEETHIRFLRVYGNLFDDAEQLILALFMLPVDQRFKFAQEFDNLIEYGDELTQVLSTFPKDSRLSFANDYANLIKTAEDLEDVLSVLPMESRFDFAVKCVKLIESEDELTTVLNELPIETKDIFSGIWKEQINDVSKLIDYLKTFPQEFRLRNAKPYVKVILNVNDLKQLLFNLLRSDIDMLVIDQAKLFQDGYDLIKLSGLLSVEVERQLANLLRRKIHSLMELTDVINLTCFHASSDEEIKEFVLGCNSKVKALYFLSLDDYSRKQFEDPLVQQLISMRRVYLTDFLRSAAQHFVCEEDFRFFLSHPLSRLDAMSLSGKCIENRILEGETLSDEMKASRMQLLKERKEQVRRAQTSHYMLLDLMSIAATSRQFSKDLPAVTPSWTASGVAAADIHRFHQLVAWLTAHEQLIDYKEDFSKLNVNVSFRKASIFKGILDELENFVSLLDSYLGTSPSVSALSSCLDATDQLINCAEGVRSALTSMSRALNPKGGIAQCIDVALDQSIRIFIDMMRIKAGMQVHTSKDRILGMMGVASELTYDSYRLPISPYYLESIAGHAMAAINGDRLLQEAFPSLEAELYLKKHVGQTFTEKTATLLLHDWELLNAVGVAPEVAEAEDKMAYALALMSDWDQEEAKAQVKIVVEAISSGEVPSIILPAPKLEKLHQEYRVSLLRSGVLKLDQEAENEICFKIWSLLTKSENFSDSEDIFWKNLLSTRDGKHWIKKVIEVQMPEVWNDISLNALLYQPKDCSDNLFRVFASDPYLAPWVSGVELKWQRGVDSSESRFEALENSPLISVLEKLAFEEVILQRELEIIFMRSGNLLFCLSELQNDKRHKHVFKTIMSFLSDLGLYYYDNILEVLAKMNEKNHELRAVAQSFLASHLAKQKKLGLWDCYWQTACYINDLELLFDHRDQLMSLNNPVNARAALYASNSLHELILKVTEVYAKTDLLSSDELVKILDVLKSLSPHSATARIAQVFGGRDARAAAGAGAIVEARLDAFS